MGGWGCPHEVDGKCQKVNDLPCDPAMKGCVLFGRFVWGDQSKNRPAGGWGGGKPQPSPEKSANPQKPSENPSCGFPVDPDKSS